ncbi:MAG: response regulator transcription factor [Crocinitomicaceae bacterium]|nr:response regulator transcription factor [Crocinitomicaceae bacterium]MBK8927593.1 response regulator transcription factor [Crocinitomicaceae bacterium]
MIRAVIIDDIPEAISVLKSDLENYCVNIEVIGSAEGVVTGAKLIREQKPDLVFLDIQMKDGSGFDLLEIVPDVHFKLIFTTASDEFAVKAFKFSAVDYLLKPIDPDELMDAVSRVESQDKPTQRIDLLKENFVKTKRIALNTLEKIHIVNIDEILRCESNINYTMFYFVDGTKLLVTKTLKEFDNLLSEHQFIRVHQSHLINANFIKEFLKSAGEIVMKDGTRVPVSTRKKQVLMDMISNF